MKAVGVAILFVLLLLLLLAVNLIFVRSLTAAKQSDSTLAVMRSDVRKMEEKLADEHESNVRLANTLKRLKKLNKKLADNGAQLRALEQERAALSMATRRARVVESQLYKLARTQIKTNFNKLSSL